ncbi:YcxB family protein [Dactylosporangium sp. NPDC049140]|uniref:YcxB family protein n=1 Tax=Dactylosporangium sp. NPDC049140 TaxID=3155647 RepID=UPI0033D0E87B
MQIRFDVPADPGYPGRVAAVLSAVRLRKFTVIGAWLLGLGVAGLALARVAGWGEPLESLYYALIIAGVLSMLYAPWVRFKAKRQSGKYAVEGGYDITDDNIMMTSGSESGGIAWDGVSRVAETPEFWIVYVGRIPATVIPKNLMSAAEAETLRAFMDERGLLPE